MQGATKTRLSDESLNTEKRVITPYPSSFKRRFYRRSVRGLALYHRRLQAQAASSDFSRQPLLGLERIGLILSLDGIRRLATRLRRLFYEIRQPRKSCLSAFPNRSGQRSASLAIHRPTDLTELS